jgi:hypothetical protein
LRDKNPFTFTFAYKGTLRKTKNTIFPAAEIAAD